MAIHKGISRENQKVFLFVRGTTGHATDEYVGVEGDASKITVKISVDGGAPVVLNDTTVTEVHADVAGHYYVTLSDLDYTSSAKHIKLFFNSSSSNTEIDPLTQEFYLEPDWVGDVLGTGYSNTTDTLAKIREYFDNNLQPVLSRAQAVTQFSGTGWLSRVTSKVYRWAQEPVNSAKTDASDMLGLIRDAIRELAPEMFLQEEFHVGVRHNFTLVENIREYVLPPCVGNILRLAKLSSDDDIQWEWSPAHHHSPSSYGFFLEGNVLRFTTDMDWAAGDSIELLYVPSGDMSPHLSTILGAAIDAAGTTVVLPAPASLGAKTVTDGNFDWRENAYGGHYFRILQVADDAGTGFPTVGNEFVEQESLISSSQVVDASGTPVITLTLRRPLSPIPSGASNIITYEIVPTITGLYEDLIALHIARTMVAETTNKKAFELLSQRYREKARAWRLFISKIQQREGSRFDNRFWNNPDLSVFWRAL